MNFACIHDIRRSGFDGFVTVSVLQAAKCCEVPNKPGVYLILRPNSLHPEFLNESVGRHFKGNNPTVTARTLEGRWVENTPVLYIGKAGHRRWRLKS